MRSIIFIYKVIVANHVQNERSSPSIVGSYAEFVTLAWDDDIVWGCKFLYTIVWGYNWSSLHSICCKFFIIKCIEKIPKTMSFGYLHLLWGSKRGDSYRNTSKIIICEKGSKQLAEIYLKFWCYKKITKHDIHPLCLQ